MSEENGLKAILSSAKLEGLESTLAKSKIYNLQFLLSASNEQLSAMGSKLQMKPGHTMRLRNAIKAYQEAAAKKNKAKASSTSPGTSAKDSKSVGSSSGGFKFEDPPGTMDLSLRWWGKAERASSSLNLRRRCQDC
uniref:Uncharacterized protein n=1 Tax=Lotharella oceanica TaxID=641309 RepID=A0A7S2TRX4_9EUKA